MPTITTKLPTPRFALCSTVYPKLAPEKSNAVIITGITFRPSQGGAVSILYHASDAEGEETDRLECELQEEAEYGAVGGGGENDGGEEA